jgi:hypothetical protein
VLLFNKYRRPSKLSASGLPIRCIAEYILIAEPWDEIIVAEVKSRFMATQVLNASAVSFFVVENAPIDDILYAKLHSPMMLKEIYRPLCF